MKKILLGVLSMAITTAAFAQNNMSTTSHPSTQWGLRVGPDFASATTQSNGNKQTSDLLVGVEGGLYVNLPLANEFYIQPSLMYEGKGGKHTYGSDYDATFRLNYLTLPVDFLFAPQMAGAGRWLIGAGPYIAYGLSGSTTFTGPNNNALVFNKNPFNGDNGLKQIDAGANVQLGYEFASGFNLGLNADLGLVNVLKNGDSDNSFRNTSFGVMAGYTFGTK